jgi:hypothetical protein
MVKTHQLLLEQPLMMVVVAGVELSKLEVLILQLKVVMVLQQK